MNALAEPRLRAVGEQLAAGRTREALAALAALEPAIERDGLLAQHVAQVYTRCGRHADARRCLTRAAQLAPDDLRVQSNLAAAEIALGRMEDAEARLDRIIAAEPRDFDAYYNRATLRRQTPARNHVAELERALATAGAAGEVALCYALAKELEDLGDDARSFEYLARGADARRRQLSYRVAADVDTLATIIAAFSPAVLAARPPVAAPSGPIFVVGLPRSGTTLVERIVSSHPDVESFGEMSELPLAVTRAAGPVPDKTTLVHRSAHADFAALGADYLGRIEGYGRQRPRFVDKTPLNLLYLGLIALALPGARVIHLRRDPLDSCYAMYKTLFRMGYPFSYDQLDLARYYTAYHRLMAHWREHLPDAFIDVDYEVLVANQERETRRLLDYGGLPFDPACLAFHENPSASATASAAQVREPIHARSVRASRRFAVQLAPLRNALLAAGIDVE